MISLTATALVQISVLLFFGGAISMIYKLDQQLLLLEKRVEDLEDQRTAASGVSLRPGSPAPPPDWDNVLT